MPFELVAIYVIVATAIVLIFTVTMLSKKTKQKTTPKASPVKCKEQHEEFVDTLNWMLLHNIIDTREYNNLMVKALPFLR